MSARKKQSSSHGEMLYHFRDERKHIESGQIEIVEKVVTHRADKLFCKLYMKKNDQITKYDILASGTGGEYIVNVTKNGAKKQTKYNKKDLLEFLKGNSELKFAIEYINKTKSLARARSKHRSGSKSRSKSGSKHRSKSGSKHRSRSKSRRH